jgi:hypothetical protein
MIHSNRAIALAAIATALAGTVAKAQAPAVVSDMREVSATVESVDARTRQVLLKMDNGSYQTLVAGPEIRNFAQIRPGDQVHARYESALAVRIGRPEQTLLADQDLIGGSRAPLGAKPGAEQALEIHRQVTITGIDRRQNTVTFLGADGVGRTVQVDAPQMQAFLQTLKVGDTVNVDYREAVIAQIDSAH